MLHVVALSQIIPQQRQLILQFEIFYWFQQHDLQEINKTKKS